MKLTLYAIALLLLSFHPRTFIPMGKTTLNELLLYAGVLLLVVSIVWTLFNALAKNSNGN
jgi:hypothetical protein